MTTRLAGLLLLALAPPVTALDLGTPAVSRFIEEMVAEHDFERDALERLLAEAEIQESILEAISRPAERVKPWHEYREIFVTRERIAAGVEFWREHCETIERISDETGVPPEILVGIVGVETYFGRITGSYRVLDALATLAFEYPPRSKFFRGELAEFLLLAREEGIDPTAAKGSYAGAMGPPQFIPSSYRAYAVDGSDDGQRDLFGDWNDVLASIANYFVRHGWRSGEPVASRATLGTGWNGRLPEKNRLKPGETVASLSRRGVVFDTDLPMDAPGQLVRLDGGGGDELWVGFHNLYVITRYNRSIMYALSVWQLGQAIGQSMEAARNADT